MCEEYKCRAGNFQPLPWIDKMQFNLENLYTKLSVVKREKSGWKKTKQIVELPDIFDKDKESRPNPRIILIEGSPGTGKTTLSLKLAYDWATGKMPNKFPEVELVLLIKCRDMEDSIQESAKTQLLPWDNDQLRNALDSFIHSGKIMLIIDGVDEIPKSAESHVVNLLNRKVLRNCYVVVTSRQEKGMEVRKYCDKLLEIDGFSDVSRNSFIDKYFTSDIYLALKLQEKIRTSTENNLQSLATNPLNALLLCVVFEDNGGDLPTTVTELYENIVESIWTRYCKRKRPEEKAISFAIAMQTLGKLAYECLIERDTLYFSESMLKDEEKKPCTNIGFLYKDDISTRISKSQITYWFLHKTFQEYFAAYYCVYIEKEIDMSKLSYYTSKDGAKFIQVLKFLSSMLQKKNTEDHKKIIAQLASRISQNVKWNSDAGLDIMCQVLSENKLDKDLAGAVKTFIQGYLTVSMTDKNIHYSIMPRILNLLGTGDEDKETLKLHALQFENFDYDTEWLRLICEALKKNLVVDEMYLVDCKVDGTFLQQMLSENSTLQYLDLTAINNITYGAVNTLAKGLCKNSTLNELSLTFTDLGEHDEPSSELTGMVEMFQTNVTLKTLCLDYNPLGSDGVTWIAEALGSNQGLKELSLMNTECDDEGAVALANMLHMNKTLERLLLCNKANEPVFRNNSIGDKGATALADVLKENNSSLRELHLCDNTNIPNTGLRKLIEAVQKNKILNLYIDLPEQTRMTLDKETVERIQPPSSCDCCKYFVKLKQPNNVFVEVGTLLKGHWQ